jgi:hypothetical protein
LLGLLAVLIAPSVLAITISGGELLDGRHAVLEARFTALRGASDRSRRALALELAQLTPAYRDAQQAWRDARPDQPWPLLVIGLTETRRAEVLLEDRPLHTLPATRRRAVQQAWAEARAALEAALALDPALGPAHAALLRLEREGIRGMSARALFERARRQAGGSWSLLAEMLDAAVGEAAPARKTLEYLHGVTRRAIGRHADFAMLAATADCALLQAAEYLDAEERRDALAEVEAQQDSAYCQDRQAALALAAGDDGSALGHALMAEHRQPDDARRLHIAALLAARHGPVAARIWLTVAIDRHGPTPATLRRLASLHWQSGEDADARRLLGLTVVWFPLDEAAWALRGQLLAREPGEREAAAQSLATAVRLDPSRVALWSELMRLYGQLPCPATPFRFSAVCTAWRCPDRVRRDPGLTALARQLERRCG